MVSFHTVGTGYGIGYYDSSVGAQTYRWHGHTFGPSYSAQNWDQSASGWFDEVYIINPTTSYDHSDFYPGHESLFFLMVLEYNGTESGSYDIELEDPDGNVLFSYSGSYSGNGDSGTTHQKWHWAGAGIRKVDYEKSYNEVYKNGTYKFIVSGDISGTYSCTVSNLVLSRLDLQPTSDIGKIWVDGNDLWYISHYGYIHPILNKGSTYGSVGTQYKGQIWIPDGASGLHHLVYVDESGDIRKTKEGDVYRDSGEEYYIGTPGTSYAGAIWVDDWNGNDLYVVMADGYIVRIGNGYLYGDMQ